jgi:hypothetical protein
MILQDEVQMEDRCQCKQVFKWRKLYREGRLLDLAPSPSTLLPENNL